MSIGALLAASLIVVPMATAKMAQAVMEDNPSHGQVGAVSVEVFVDPEGRAYRCKALRVVGDEAFGAAACKSQGRWRLAIPIGADGLPTFAIFRAIAVFSPGSPLSERQLQALFC